MRFRWATLLILVLSCASAARAQTPNPAASPERTGEQIDMAACAACHAPDGKGQPQSVLGFEPPPTFPDFTDCAVGTPEPDLIWLAVVHWGGRARAESHIMPAFGDTLTDAEIQRVVDHLRSFCAEPGWPMGNLNFPRAFFTEKAFPENETVFTVSTATSHPHAVEPRVDYEHRVGRRGQYEVGVPVAFQQNDAGEWAKGLGDTNFAYRYTFFANQPHRSIAAAGAEVTLPTGKENEGLGGGVTVWEAFAMMGQGLPHKGFIHIHTGFERPANHDIAPNAYYFRTAVGKTFTHQQWGRQWSPMVEFLADKDLEDGTKTNWDIVPQVQVSLSKFQHILLDVGVRMPMNEREGRSTAVMTYLLWDWFDGPFFSMWRAH